MKKIFLLPFLFLSFVVSANDTEVVMHNPMGGNHNQIYIEPPYVTYDDELNELTVYFGSTSTIDLECVDATGIPYYYVYGESHPGYTSANYYSLPTGYYTITIHSIYGYTYTGNFTVS